MAYTVNDADGKTLTRELAPLESIKDHNLKYLITMDFAPLLLIMELSRSTPWNGYSTNAIVIGVAAVVPHNARADSLMEEISLFVEDNCEAEILDEVHEIR